MKRINITDKSKMEEETIDYCLKDYKHRHYWESIGVIAYPNLFFIYQVFKCSQCQKIMLEELEKIGEKES